jgi:hypothetical protein
MEDFQFLEPRADGGGDGSRYQRSSPAAMAPASSGGYDEPEPDFAPPPAQEKEGEIPF